MNEKTKTDCKFSDTPICGLLNAGNCKNCPLFQLNEKETEDVCSDIRSLCGFLPENGVEYLFSETECALCRGGIKGKPEGFAQLNMGHLNPNIPDVASGQASRLIKKREARLVVPVQIPVCAACRKRLLLKYSLPSVICLLFALSGLLITASEKVRAALASVSRSGPFTVFAAIALLGAGIALLVKSGLDSGIKRNMKIKPSEIEQLDEMLKKGWFTLPMGRNEPNFTFTGRRLKRGLLTGNNQKAYIEAVLNKNGRMGTREAAETTPDNDF